MPGALQGVDEKAAEAVVVLGEKNLGHLSSRSHAGAGKQYELSPVVVKRE
jgi:hypothetical protein